MDNNIVNVSGILENEMSYSHQQYGIKFYRNSLAIMRKSGTVDRIPVVFPDRFIDSNISVKGKTVFIHGNYRSYNYYDDSGQRHLDLYIYVQDFDYIDYDCPDNSIEISGHICSTPVFRQTPFGRFICDFILASNRNFGRSDYIPCICWGYTARQVSKLSAGSPIIITGRIQSREYCKVYEGFNSIKTAYEVSANQVHF